MLRDGPWPAAATGQQELHELGDFHGASPRHFPQVLVVVEVEKVDDDDDEDDDDQKGS